jgi:hypothetical protein
MSLQNQILYLISLHQEASRVIMPDNILDIVDNDLSFLPPGITLFSHEIFVFTIQDKFGSVLGNYTIEEWR